MGNAMISNGDQHYAPLRFYVWMGVGCVISTIYFLCEWFRNQANDGTTANQVAASLQSVFQTGIFIFAWITVVFTHILRRRT